MMHGAHNVKQYRYLLTKTSIAFDAVRNGQSHRQKLMTRQQCIPIKIYQSEINSH